MKFSFGVKSELNHFPLTVPKALAGSWPGTGGAVSSLDQGLASQHPPGLAGPWRADDAELLT